MITIQRPGQDPLEIEFILIDFEGTLASDRRVHPKAKDKINLLSKRTKIYILTKGEKELVEKLEKSQSRDISFNGRRILSAETGFIAINWGRPGPLP